MQPAKKELPNDTKGLLAVDNNKAKELEVITLTMRKGNGSGCYHGSHIRTLEHDVTLF